MSHFYKNEGFKKNDVIATSLENRLDYNSTWIGMAKLGIISAQINTNIRSQPLVHTFDVVKAKAVVFTNETENCNKAFSGKN